MITNEQRIYNLEKAVQALQQDAYGAQATDNITPTPPLPGEKITVPASPTPHAAIVKPAISQHKGNMVNGRLI
jgi:hypothetical protein